MREGWTKQKLGDVIKLEYGKPLPNDQRCADSGFPAYGANGIKCYAVVPYWKHPSIIVGRKGTAGAVNLVGGGFWPLDVTYYVTFDDREYDLNFLHYMLSALDLPSLATGVKPGINRNVVYGIEQYFPPLPEQRHIVAILDEAFAGITTTVANTEKNLDNARGLFESFLNSLFLRNEHVWASRKLEQVCKKITVGHVGSMAKRYKSDGIPLLRSQNIRAFRVDLEKVVYIDQEFHAELKKSALRPGDLGIVRTGYPGTAAVIPHSLPVANCSDLVIVRPGDQVLSDFLAVVFNSTFGKQAVAGVLVGAAQKHFNVTAAKAALVPIPSIKEQGRIVAESNEVREECEKIVAIYRRKLTALAELKQSLLRKAFSGELTAEKEAPTAALKEEEVG